MALLDLPLERIAEADWERLIKTGAHERSPTARRSVAPVLDVIPTPAPIRDAGCVRCCARQ
jgi:hypothetical protein